MKITAIVGSARKGHTFKAVNDLLFNLNSLEDIDSEIIMLSNYRVEPCTGCKLCFEKGEGYCPLKDDIALLVKKIEESDGIIMATPNYAFHVSGLMKNFLDRIAYIFHRPQFFGKVYTSVVAQGIYGANKIIKYFNFIGPAMGFISIKGSCITTLEPMSDKLVLKNNRIIEKHSKKFSKTLVKPKLPKPSVLKVIMFRISRTKINTMLNENFRDYSYYEEQGWFRSDYYYPVKLNWIVRLVANLTETIVKN